MTSIIVWVAEFFAEVIVATIAQFMTEVVVSWVAEMAQAAIVEGLTAIVAEATGLFAELLSRILRP